MDTYYNRGVSVGADPSDAVWHRDPDTGNWLLTRPDGTVVRAAAPGGAPISGPPNKPVEAAPQTVVPPGSNDLPAIAMNVAAKKAATDSRPMMVTFSVANRAVVDEFGNRMPVIESMTLNEAHERYGKLADTPQEFDYVALFNPKKETGFDPPGWPEPDLWFGGSTIAVPIHVRTKTGVGGWVAAGIATMLGLIVVSGQKKRRS